MSHARIQALIFSAKTALGALLALWISLWEGLPMPFWAMTTAYIVSSPLSGATRSKAIYRVAGTLIGAGVAVALVPWLVQWPELLSLAVALWVGGCLAVSLLDRSPRAYMLMLSGYTAALVAFPGVSRPEAVFDTASARLTEIVLGIVCATLAHSLLWPQSVAAALEPRLRAWLADARRWHGDIMAGADDPVTTRDRRQLATDAVECAILATHVPFDTSHWREASASLQALLRRMLLLLPVLSGLADRQRALPGAGDDWSPLLAESARLRDGQAATLLAESELLLAHLANPHAPPPAVRGDASGKLAFHADPALAALSGLAATIAILACCALWIGTGWADGAAAAALTGVFCCLFAAQDNPVPAIITFGLSILAGVPLAALCLFVALPRMDDFPGLTLVLIGPLLFLGSLVPHPRWGQPATAMLVGFLSAMAIQENYDADFARFLNGNLGQLVAVVLAAGFTAGLRAMSSETAIARLVGRMRRDMAALAGASGPPDPAAALGRSVDQMALITQRLGGDDRLALTGLLEVRIAMNIVIIQQLRAGAALPLREALSALLREMAGWFSGKPDTPPPQSLLTRIDTALRLTLRDTVPASGPNAGETSALLRPGAEQGRPALVALRRNLFPHAPAFRTVPA